MKKNLTKNCVCGEKKDKYEVCSSVPMYSLGFVSPQLRGKGSTYYINIRASHILSIVQFFLSDICNICNHISEYVNSSEEDGFVEELVVVVKQDGSVVHRGEANCWDSHLCKFL